MRETRSGRAVRVVLGVIASGALLFSACLQWAQGGALEAVSLGACAAVCAAAAVAVAWPPKAALIEQGRS